MTFGNLPEEVLNHVIGETYDGPYSVRDELKYLPEEIVDSIFRWSDDGKRLNKVVVWTKSFVYVLVDSVFSDQCFIEVPRNPS